MFGIGESMKLEREIIEKDGLKIAKFKIVYEPIKEEKLEPCDSFSYERGEEDGNAN